jgi:2-keto-4-pentenoate hydratase
MTNTVDAMAAGLYRGAKALERFDPIDEALRPGDTDQGYAVQDAYQALARADGAGDIVGWKVALTSKVMQELLGCNQPCEGAIFATRLHASPARVAGAGFANLGVESEIAVRLGRDLPAGNGPHTRDTVADAVAACMAGIELVDDRAADYGAVDAPLLIGMNSLNAGCVLGPDVTDWRSLDLAAIKGRMVINGEIVGEGVGGDALGHPLEPLAWLANNLNRRGTMLKAGQVVMTGSIVTTKWLQPGDEMATMIDGLGEARVTVT